MPRDKRDKVAEKGKDMQSEAWATSRLQTKAHVMPTIPCSRVAIFLNAASERSIELPFSQVGQASAMVTVTDFLLAGLVI